MKIVIDTNIWISGLLWKGKAWQLIRLIEQKQVENCIAYQIALELEEVLAYERLEARMKELKKTPAHLANYALKISTAFEVSRTGPPIIEEDPDDDIFLLCAERAQAIYIVSNDRHLRKLKQYGDVVIVTVDDFLSREFQVE